MRQATDLAGPVGVFAAASAAGDLAAMKAAALSILATRAVALPHPERPEVMTFGRASRLGSMTNTLVLSDAEGGNRWALIQGGNCIRGVMTEAAVYSLVSERDLQVDRAVQALRGGEADALWQARHSYGGLILHSSRPFHFFYDQLVVLPELLPHMPDGLRTVHLGPSAFMTPALLWGVETAAPTPGQYFLMPGICGGQRLHRRNPAAFFAQAERMERAIAATIPPQPRPDGADLVLWIGITGQKRVWRQQVEGHVAIIRALTERFPRLVIYADGITAPLGGKVRTVEDAAVVAEIAAAVEGQARVVSLVGRDYASKVAHAHGVDAFIANGGTGCMVPLRFCRKPGVMHSNRDVWTFPNDSYPDTVVFLDRVPIREHPTTPGAKAGRVDYSLAWQEIYNALAEVLGKVRGVALSPLAVPDPPFEAGEVGEAGATARGDG